jgi:hypothetical protein
MRVLSLSSSVRFPALPEARMDMRNPISASPEPALKLVALLQSLRTALRTSHFLELCAFLEALEFFLGGRSFSSNINKSQKIGL